MRKRDHDKILKNYQAEIDRLRAEVKRLRGTWQNERERCPQCGCGLSAHPLVEELRTAAEERWEGAKT